MRYITLKWAKDRHACAIALGAFERRFGTKATTKRVLTWLNDINRPDWLGWVMSQNDIDITAELLGFGADIQSFDDCALQWAANYGRLDVVKFLVKHGADVCASGGDNALRLAAESGHLDVVKFLVKHGADVCAHNDYALQVAVKNGHTETAEFLRQAGR